MVDDKAETRPNGLNESEKRIRCNNSIKPSYSPAGLEMIS